MLTIGRFKTNTRLCLSISDYHPKTWNPAWSVSTILTGLLSFMVSDETTAGSIATSSSDKVRLAKESHAWNLYQDSRFLKHFPELAEENRKLIADKQAESKTVSANKTSSAAPNKTPISDNANSANTNTKPNYTSASESGNQQGTSAQSSMSTTQKMLWVCVLLVSWVVASRMFSSSS